MFIHFMAVDDSFIPPFEVWCGFSNLSLQCHLTVSFTAINLSSFVPDGCTLHFTGSGLPASSSRCQASGPSSSTKSSSL